MGDDAAVSKPITSKRDAYFRCGRGHRVGGAGGSAAILLILQGISAPFQHNEAVERRRMETCAGEAFQIVCATKGVCAKDCAPEEGGRLALEAGP